MLGSGGVQLPQSTRKSGGECGGDAGAEYVRHWSCGPHGYVTAPLAWPGHVCLGTTGAWSKVALSTVFDRKKSPCPAATGLPGILSQYLPAYVGASTGLERVMDSTPST